MSRVSPGWRGIRVLRIRGRGGRRRGWSSCGRCGGSGRCGRRIGCGTCCCGGEFADEFDEGGVVGVAACFGAEHGGNVVGGAVPVEEEFACGAVEVDEAGGTGGPAWVGQDRCVERSAGGLAASTLSRASHTQAGASVMASRIYWTVAVTPAVESGRPRRAGVRAAACARSNRCPRSASSSCRARASGVHPVHQSLYGGER
jgi:hypothetical protein